MTERISRKPAGPDRDRKVPRRITPDYLRRAALHYLERYAAPAAQLRRVLSRKVLLSCRHHGGDPAQFSTLLDDVVARCISMGLVDDRRFAEARATTLRRKGRSSRAVTASLAAKGVGRDLAQEAGTVGVEDEMAAAMIAARRKRLGPWSRSDRQERRSKEARNKDLAALVRAGFSMTIARAVIDGAGDDSEMSAS